RDRDLVHADDEPVDVAVAARRRQFLLEPRLLCALGIAPDIGIAAVLVADIVIGNADDAHRAHGEGVPEAARHIALPRGRRQREIGLIGLIANGAIAELVLVIAGRRHPRAVARAAAVIAPEIPPG